MKQGEDLDILNTIYINVWTMGFLLLLYTKGPETETPIPETQVEPRLCKQT